MSIAENAWVEIIDSCEWVQFPGACGGVGRVMSLQDSGKFHVRVFCPTRDEFYDKFIEPSHIKPIEMPLSPMAQLTFIRLLPELYNQAVDLQKKGHQWPPSSKRETIAPKII